MIPAAPDVDDGAKRMVSGVIAQFGGVGRSECRTSAGASCGVTITRSTAWVVRRHRGLRVSRYRYAGAGTTAQAVQVPHCARCFPRSGATPGPCQDLLPINFVKSR